MDKLNLLGKLYSEPSIKRHGEMLQLFGLEDTPRKQPPSDGTAIPSLANTWRLGAFRIVNLLGGLENAFGGCELTRIFDPETASVNTAAGVSDSKSGAVLVFGTLRQPREVSSDAWERVLTDAVAKISFSEQRAVRPDEPYVAEMEIYRQVTKLVDARVTPNLITIIGSVTCAYNELIGTPDSRDSRAAAEMREQVEKAVAAAVGDRHHVAHVLLTERSYGEPLSSRWASLNDEQMLALLFQLIYTLHALQERGIRHGDLHPGNVLVEDTKFDKVPPNITYVVDDQEVFRVPAAHVAKIFDWDHGGIYDAHRSRRMGHFVLDQSLPSDDVKNYGADYHCERLSTCGRNAKADAFTLLSSLFDLVQMFPNVFPKTIAFVQRVVHQKLLNAFSSSSDIEKRGGFRHRLCNRFSDPAKVPCPDDVGEVNESECNGAWEPPDCWMKTPRVMLDDEAFAQWHVKKRRDERVTGVVFSNWRLVE